MMFCQPLTQIVIRSVLFNSWSNKRIWNVLVHSCHQRFQHFTMFTVVIIFQVVAYKQIW